jgi:hypothetical protein
MNVFDSETNELLGEIDIEGLTESEILNNLEDCDYINYTDEASIRHGHSGMLHIYIGTRRVLDLATDDDEDEDDIEFEDADD